MGERKLNLRLSDEELEQLRALAADEERSANTLLRRMVRVAFETRFGKAVPKSKKAAKR